MTDNFTKGDDIDDPKTMSYTKGISLGGHINMIEVYGSSKAASGAIRDKILDLLNKNEEELTEVVELRKKLIAIKVAHEKEILDQRAELLLKITQQKKRVKELEKKYNNAEAETAYYRQQLTKAHALLGRVVHQNSERWDQVRLTEYYPTDNMHSKRSIDNPEGE